jgi:Flp pilus assembly protein TadD
LSDGLSAVPKARTPTERRLFRKVCGALVRKFFVSARAKDSTLRTATLAAACAAFVLRAFFFGAGAAARAQRQAESYTPARVAEVVAKVSSAALSDDAFAQALALGYALFSEGRFAESAELFDALVVRRPRDPSALYGAALATFNAGRAAEAEPLARRAVESARTASVESARTADALVLLAVVLAVRGDDAGALKSAREAVALAPESFDAQFTLGRALYGAGDAAAASRVFRSAVALKPNDAQARFFLATSLEESGDDDGALAAYRELATREPRAPEGHLGLGVLLLKRGGAGAEEGLKELSRAIEINPDLYEARVALGRALVARGRAAEAIEHLRRAAELAPGNPEPHYQLSLAYRRLGRRAESEAESETVRRIHESRRSTGSPQNKPPAANGP